MSSVRDFGAMGDGIADDTGAIQDAIRHGDGVIEFPQGNYRITKTIVVPLDKVGRIAFDGNGGVGRIIMAGEGPAISLVGTHTKSADPTGFAPVVWERERMPTVSGLEIVGAHPNADGIRIQGTMQSTLTGVLIRRVRTAVHVTGRARNIVISHCHMYQNTGIGVHLDGVNLHQTIIADSHISYCRLGAIRIEASEIRNLQITGNDLEYSNNRVHGVKDADAEPTAEIYIDVGTGTVREGTIASNTIQATCSRNGANIRFVGRTAEESHKAGLFTITGNLIGSQDTNIHLTSVRGVTITGNVIYSGNARNVLIESSRNVVLGSNCFDHNPDYKDKEISTGIRIVDSVDCSLNGSVIQDSHAGKTTVKDLGQFTHDALIELVRCRRMNLSGLHLVDPTPFGILAEDCHDTLITGCSILDSRSPKQMEAAIRWKGPGTGNMIAHCRLGRGQKDTVLADHRVHQADNLED